MNGIDPLTLQTTGYFLGLVVVAAGGAAGISYVFDGLLPGYRTRRQQEKYKREHGGHFGDDGSLRPDSVVSYCENRGRYNGLE